MDQNKSKQILLSPPYVSDKDKEAVMEALSSGWVAPNGPSVADFEQALSEYYQRKVALTNSGSSALHIALKAVGVSQGDYVICPTFTFAATAFPVLYQKAIPVFIDAEKDTWNMCPEFLLEAVEQLIKKNKKPKAVILAHIYGNASRIDEIQSVCSRYEIPLIEDAAETLGSFYKKKPLGTFGECAILSFNGNKIITGSSGGAFISNTNNVDKVRFWINQSKVDSAKFIHGDEGYNYTMSNILAALAFSQFQQLNEKVINRRANFKFYQKLFKAISTSYPVELPNTISNRWLSVFAFSKEIKAEIIEKFSNQNIEVRHLWTPLHRQKPFEGSMYFGDGFSIELFQKGLCFPSGSQLSLEDKERIAQICKL